MKSYHDFGQEYKYQNSIPLKQIYVFDINLIKISVQFVQRNLKIILKINWKDNLTEIANIFLQFYVFPDIKHIIKKSLNQYRNGTRINSFMEWNIQPKNTL